MRFFNCLAKTWAKNVTECFEPPILSNIVAMGPSGSRVWVNFVGLVSFSALTTVYSVPFTDLAYRTALYSSNSGTSGKGLDLKLTQSPFKKNPMLVRVSEYLQ